MCLPPLPPPRALTSSDTTASRYSFLSFCSHPFLYYPTTYPLSLCLSSFSSPLWQLHISLSLSINRLSNFFYFSFRVFFSIFLTSPQVLDYSSADVYRIVDETPVRSVIRVPFYFVCTFFLYLSLYICVCVCDDYLICKCVD